MGVRYKTIGKKEYAYSYDYHKDKKTNKRIQKSKYLGLVINKKKKIYEKVRIMRERKENLILDYGGTFILNKILEKSNLGKIIEEVFGDYSSFVKGLMFYKLSHGGAMRLANHWLRGDYARILFRNISFESQRISEKLKIIGDENYLRNFFKRYIKNLGAKDGVVIDATSLPNQINIPITCWGRCGEDIDKQIRFLLVVDKKNEMPLFYKYYSGNIVDVSTLKKTFEELEKYNIKETYVYLDAGYYSKDNLLDLYNNKIDFLTRLPSITIIYKSLVKDYHSEIENLSNIVRYGKRALFIKRVETDFYGKNIYAYLVIDPERKGRETKNLAMKIIGQEVNEDSIYSMKTRGLMILISSTELTKEEVVPAYYVRQTAEKMFGFSKDDLSLLPLNVHNEDTLKGFLFIQFLTLCFFMELKKQLGKKYSIEEVLMIMKSLKCKIFNEDILICELTKQHKEVIKLLDLVMPKRAGI